MPTAAQRKRDRKILGTIIIFDLLVFGWNIAMIFVDQPSLRPLYGALAGIIVLSMIWAVFVFASITKR